MFEGVPQAVSQQEYPATFSVDYQEKLSRVTTLFRSILIIPIAIILGIVASGFQKACIFGALSVSGPRCARPLMMKAS